MLDYPVWWDFIKEVMGVKEVETEEVPEFWKSFYKEV